MRSDHNSRIRTQTNLRGRFHRSLLLEMKDIIVVLLVQNYQEVSEQID